MKIRFHGTFAALAVTAALLPMQVQAAPTATQLCESAITLGSAHFAQCRLNAESKAVKGSLSGQKFTDALTKCSTKLSDAYVKATTKYGMACAATEPSTAFDAYLTQCSDDTTAAAGGAPLPDYVGDLASCNADLTTCNGDLSTCNADLTTAQGDLTTCEADLAACEATPSAHLLKTGQTTSYGSGTDGNLQVGVARAYLDNGDGTITDTRTGLMWEKKSDDGTIHDKDNQYAWSTSGSLADGPAFTTFLATLNVGGGFAGHTDWRLPNQFELESLQNFEKANPSVSAAFDTNCGVSPSYGNAGCTVLTCSCTSVQFGYWSSTSRAGSGLFAWVRGFSEGHVTYGQKTVASSVLRAVRGS